MQNWQKSGGQIANRENLEICIFFLALFSAEPRIFAKLTRFKAEFRRTQNTKHVRKRSRINPEVESKRTAQYGEKKLEQKARRSGETEQRMQAKFFQSRPNWTPPARGNHHDTSRIKAQKPNRAEIRSSPRIERGSPLRKNRARPGRKFIPGKKTFQIQQQSMPNFSEISGLQCVNYSSKIRRNHTRKIGHKNGKFCCWRNSQLMEESRISGKLMDGIRSFKMQILFFNSIKLGLIRIRICFQKYSTQGGARAYKKKKKKKQQENHASKGGQKALLAPNNNFEKSFRRHPLELQNAPYIKIFVSLSSFSHKNFRIFRFSLVFLISLTPTLLQFVSKNSGLIFSSQ